MKNIIISYLNSRSGKKRTLDYWHGYCSNLADDVMHWLKKRKNTDAKIIYFKTKDYLELNDFSEITLSKYSQKWKEQRALEVSILGKEAFDWTYHVCILHEGKVHCVWYPQVTTIEEYIKIAFKNYSNVEWKIF